MILLIIIVFLGVVLYLGIPRRSDETATVSDHVIAGRSLALWPIFFIGVAEFYSAGTFLGFPGWGLWLRCAGAVFRPPLVAIALSSMMSFWLGPKVWRAGKKLGLMTQAQFLSNRFQSRLLGRDSGDCCGAGADRQPDFTDDRRRLHLRGVDTGPGTLLVGEPDCLRSGHYLRSSRRSAVNQQGCHFQGYIHAFRTGRNRDRGGDTVLQRPGGHVPHPRPDKTGSPGAFRNGYRFRLRVLELIHPGELSRYPHGTLPVYKLLQRATTFPDPQTGDYRPHLCACRLRRADHRFRRCAGKTRGWWKRIP